MNRNNRCWFRARINHEKVFKCKTIEIMMSDFYGCLKDSVEKPLSYRIRIDEDLQSHTAAVNDHIINSYTKDAMHNIRQAVLCQAEQFFDEFYHYNFEDMQQAIKECLEGGERC